MGFVTGMINCSKMYHAMTQQTAQLCRLKGGVTRLKGQESSTSQMASGSGSGEDWSLQTGLSAGHTPGGQDTGDEQTQEEMGSSGGRREEDTALSLPELTRDMLLLHNREMEKQLVNSFMEAKNFGESANIFRIYLDFNHLIQLAFCLLQSSNRVL